MGIKYKDIANKYGLPDFDILNNEFELSKLDEAEFPLREIRKKIMEKMRDMADILSRLIQPDSSSLLEMSEYRFFGEDDRKKMNELINKLMSLDRQGLETEIENSNEEIAEFIKTVMNNWENIKKQMKKIIGKMRQSWKEEVEAEEKADYMG